MKNVKSGIHPMDELKTKLKDITKIIPQGSKVYYLDYPVYGNGGDLLIMKGTEKFFGDYNINVQARFSLNAVRRGLTIPKDCIIVLQGGGNFGDIYPIFQRFRERIVLDYPDHKIVILPQTIYFEDETEFDKSAAVFNQHKNLHIFVRDKYCFEIAKKKLSSCNVYLSPDMAHQLWPIRYSSDDTKDTLNFLRMDTEAPSEKRRMEAIQQKDNRDWDNIFSSLDFSIIKMMSKIHRLNGYIYSILPARLTWYKFSDYLVKKTCDLFKDYETIRTSRLHGHILSCLMDKRNILLDNSYGKNSSYYHTWTYRCNNVELLEINRKSDLA